MEKYEVLLEGGQLFEIEASDWVLSNAHDILYFYQNSNSPCAGLNMAKVLYWHEVRNG
jgi:hypothetical protein